MPLRCLYDNAKVVVLGREEDGRPRWNPRFLDFALRVGFDSRLCRPYRPQTKGRVESGIKYLRNNFWPSARFTDLADLNRQVREWCCSVADTRIHGTTGERPEDRLLKERSHLRSLPDRGRLTPFLREERKVGRDGYVQWQGSWYGVPWTWAGQGVQVQAEGSLVKSGPESNGWRCTLGRDAPDSGSPCPASGRGWGWGILGPGRSLWPPRWRR